MEQDEAFIHIYASLIKHEAKMAAMQQLLVSVVSQINGEDRLKLLDSMTALERDYHQTILAKLEDADPWAAAHLDKRKLSQVLGLPPTIE